MSDTSSTLSIALVGFGYWGANVGRNIAAAASTELAAVVDCDQDRLRQAKAAFPTVRIAESLEEILEDDSITAVAIATPAPTHASLAVQSMEAGRHVLVEKPLAMSSRDAEEVARTAASTGLICMAGHTFLYSEPVRFLRSYIESGELGKLRYLSSQRLNLGRVRTDCNALWNFGPHDVSILVYLLDELPTEVSANGLSYLQPAVDDVCFATLRFPSGVGASIHLSWLDPRKTRQMTVVGDKKMAVYDDVSVDRKVSIYDSGVAPHRESETEFNSFGDFQWRTCAGSIEIPHIPLREPLLTEVEAFAHACVTGSPPLTDARHGAHVVRVLEAIDLSAKHRGAPVPVEW